MFQLSAWTDDFKVGGFVFHRDPPRDPQADKYEIKLDKCRDQLIRFTDTDNKPVPNFDFDLIIGTGEPNYQFIQNIPISLFGLTTKERPSVAGSRIGRATPRT